MKRLLVVALALGAAVFSHAFVLWDNTALVNGFTFRTAGGTMPAGHWMNGNNFPILLSQISFLADPGENTNVKYVFTDDSGAVLDTVTVFHNDVGLALYSAQVNWTVGAFESFYIVSMHERGLTEYGYTVPSGTLQNTILGLDNGNFDDYNNPTITGGGVAEMSWRLEGTLVPEPATLAVFGLGALGLLRRKRS